jgi:hypothetical protein
MEHLPGPHTSPALRDSPIFITEGALLGVSWK